MRFFVGTLAVAYLFYISGAISLSVGPLKSTKSKINQPCTSDIGQCKALDDCPVIQEDVIKEIMGGTFIMDLLKNTNCGLVDGKPQFCCPSTQETITPIDHPNILLLPTATCGADFSDKILGGKEAKLKQFPWMALLQYEKDAEPKILCGGSLINEYYVLTAAHCVKNDKEKKYISVSLGEHDVLTDPDCDDSQCSDLLQIFSIDEFIRHPKYDKKKKTADIALIRLNRKAVFTEYVVPICLPSLETQEKNYVNRNLIVAGWGATEIEMASDVKQWLRVPVVNKSRCAETLDVAMDETLMCAGSVEGEATCVGDSGGPLMIQESVAHFRPGTHWVVAAIVQGGTWICGTKGVPGLYTRVTPYIRWISDNMRP